MSVKWMMGAMATLAAVSVSAATIGLTNPGFEAPDLGKITTGFGTSGKDVPGWNNVVGKTYTDSGIEAKGFAHSGDYCAYIYGADGSAVQLTDHQIAAGETFMLSLWSYGWDADFANKAQLCLYYDNGGTREYLRAEYVLVSPSLTWQENSFTVEATGASIGKYLGIELLPGARWVAIDDVSLTYTPVPEPSALALLAATLVGLRAGGRRRR